MATTKDSALAHPSTRISRGIALHRERGVCADCGGSAKALQAPRPNVGTGYEGPMYCRECNTRFRALDFHYASLERMAV